MVSAVAALMAAMMVVISAPAMADDNDFNRFGIFGDLNDDDNDLIDLINDLDDDNDLNDLFDLNDLDNNGFDNALEQDSESGDVETNFEVSNTGDYASQCTPATQFGNTGNFNNGSTFVQGFSDLDDFEPDGIGVGFGGGQSTDCSNTIEQSSAASSW